MNIDWFTFAAQIFNFLVLVVLLRWLLYEPIIRAMEEREEKIANRLQEANRKREEAENRKSEYEQKTQEFDEQHEQRLNESRQEAEKQRRQLLDEAKQAVDAKRDEWNETLDREREDLVAEIRREAAHVGFRAARQTLSQLADTELEQRICQAFAERIEKLDKQQHDEISQQLDDGNTNCSVASQFDLSDECKERLRQAVNGTFEIDGDIRFEKSDELICGLELEIGGYSIGWNANGFLQDMERRLNEKMKL